MNPGNFFKLLKKYSYIIAIIMLGAGIASYLLVRKLPDIYVSQARLSTGIVDETQQQSFENVDISQESKVKQEFSNLIQLIQLKRVLNQVSYKLILHDLTSDTVFRKPSKNIKYLNPGAKKHAIEVYTKKYQDAELLSPWDQDQLGLQKVMASMGYDDATIGGKLQVSRVNTSDFIEISYESENPLLSAYIVNTVASEFYTYYRSLVTQNRLRGVTFLENLMRQKEESMNSKVGELKRYKIENRVLNLAEQARILYGQISDFETRRQLAERDIEANAGALKSIDDKFNEKDKKYLEASISPINEEIASLKERIYAKNDEYIRSNYDAKYKAQLDTLENQLNNKALEASNRYLYSPLASKQNLVAQKLQLEVNLQLARNGVRTLTQEIGALNTKFDKLVPHEAVIQSFESSIDIAGKEYIDVLNKYNQSRLESSMATKLKQVEQGMPGDPKPSKKMALVAISVIVSFVLCVLVLFILFYLDDTLKEPAQLLSKTKLPVLGYLNFFKTIPADVSTLWTHTQTSHEVLLFRKLFRSIHFEIKNDIHHTKTLAITSMGNGEGKTLFAIGLACSYALTNKKVLLIDGNFNNPSISKTIPPTGFIEDFIKNDSNSIGLDDGTMLHVLGNKGGEYSTFELFDEDLIRNRMEVLYPLYDIIIIEAESMDALNRSKEWVLFADKTIAVFQSGSSITEPKKVHVQLLRSLESKFCGWVMNKTMLNKKDQFL